MNTLDEIIRISDNLLRRLLWLPEQASTAAPRVDHLHYLVILTTFAVSLGVAIFSIGAYVRYRRQSADQKVETVLPSWRFEVLAIGVPLGTFLLFWVWGFRLFIDIETPPPDAMDVYVMAKKWVWKFSYPGGPSSVEVLHVPAGRPIRLLMTSRDVIHSFYVPSFRLKQDVLPARYTQLWFQALAPGHHQILCAELCGVQHSQMWGEIIVHEPADFADWLEAERRSAHAKGNVALEDGASRQDSGFTNLEPPAADLIEQGRRVALSAGCVKCHTENGDPHIGPTFLDLYGKTENLTGGEVILADDGYLTQSIMDPLAKIVLGYAPVMPTYQGRLSPPEVAAILEYLRNLRSAGPAPTPSRSPRYERTTGQ